MANQQAVQRWLDNVQLLTDEGLAELSVGDRAALEQLLGHRGMELLLGLMMGTRQGLYVQLAAMPLHSPEHASRASVTQGKIAGIDLLWGTLLEIAVPPKAAEEGATQ